MVLESDSPAIGAVAGEGLWFGLQAQIKVTPVMTPNELAQGLSEIFKVIGNYA